MRWLAALAFVLVALTGCQGAPMAERPSPSPILTSTPSALPSPNPLLAGPIQRLDSNAGFVVTSNESGSGLARTLDSGRTWSAVRTPLQLVTTIQFIDQNLGWLGGLLTDKVSAVLRTTDGGASWKNALTVSAAPGGYPPLQMQVIDGKTALVLIPSCDGCSAVLLRTLDAGRTWTTTATMNIVAMHFVSAERGWIAVQASGGRIDVYLTIDGGSSWSSRAHTTFGEVVGLDAVGSSAWLLTRAGGYCTATTCERYQLLRTTDMGMSWQDLGNPKPPGSVCMGGQLLGPLFLTASRGVLAENTGAGGARASTGWLHSEDGGGKWSCIAAPSQVRFVSAATPLSLWVATADAGGSPGEDLRASDDGGATWHSVDVQGL